jgi:hypothetical protein
MKDGLEDDMSKLTQLSYVINHANISWTRRNCEQDAVYFSSKSNELKCETTDNLPQNDSV